MKHFMVQSIVCKIQLYVGQILVIYLSQRTLAV